MGPVLGLQTFGLDACDGLENTCVTAVLVTAGRDADFAAEGAVPG
jgi:hypothetical protein